MPVDMKSEIDVTEHDILKILILILNSEIQNIHNEEKTQSQ